MTGVTPGELNASVVISLIGRGAYPREMILTVARGFLPLAQDDLIAVLAYLAASEDTEVAELAVSSLTDIPFRTIQDFASNESLPAEHLARLARATSEPSILEALIRNRAVPDDAVVDLARRGDAHVQEVIVINQARILRAPEILDALLENPRLTAEPRRRVMETREEFFEKKLRLEALKAALPDETFDELPDDPIADLLEQAVVLDAQPQTGVTLPPPEELSEEKGRSVYSLILQMTVSEKVKLAFKGDKTVRTILIRERNRLICSAAMRNPRMTENEVESISGMRNVEEEVLRIIGQRRDWTAKYPIALALVKNPKAPLGVVLPLINRLTLRDLKGLKDDKGVSEAVRQSARRLFMTRQK